MPTKKAKGQFKFVTSGLEWFLIGVIMGVSWVGVFLPGFNIYWIVGIVGVVLMIVWLFIKAVKNLRGVK